MENLNYFNQQLPLIGVVTGKRDDRSGFTVRTRGGSEFEALFVLLVSFNKVDGDGPRAVEPPQHLLQHMCSSVGQLPVVVG